MDKVFSVVLPIVGVALIIGLFIGYSEVTAKGEPETTNKQLLDDRAYLQKNQDAYADCQYTVEVGDFSIATVTNRYYNQGVSKQKLESLESQFKDKYKQQCQPILDGYRARYTAYTQHQKDAAAAELSQLDKWMGKKPEVVSERSPIMGLYQEYDPKSLQYPTNPNAKMLYTQQDYEDFIMQKL